MDNLLNEINGRFPEDVNLLLAKKTVTQLRQLNPKTLIKIWYLLVAIPYKDRIINGEIDYFLDKDYTQDIKQLENIQKLAISSDKILDIINQLRDPIKQLPLNEKKTYTDKIIQLTKLSILNNAPPLLST